MTQAKAAAAPRVVLDTNLVLSALVFTSGRLAALRSAWQAGSCTPLASASTASELMRVLAFPKFKLSDDEQEQLLADYLPYCHSVRIPARLPALPRCRDPKDQMFTGLAACAKADYLVSGNKDLLALAPMFSRRIVSVEVFLQRLDGD